MQALTDPGGLYFSTSALAVSSDGSVLRGLSIPWYQPNADDSFTVIYGDSAARYKDPKTPLWQVNIKNFGGFTVPTSDGGASEKVTTRQLLHRMIDYCDLPLPVIGQIVCK